MKRLYVLRHSKAGQTNKHIPDDHERSLTQKGLDICPLVAEKLKAYPAPDIVIASDAVRTMQTADFVLESMHLDMPIKSSNRLYLASVENIFEVLHEVSDAVDSLLLVGHNPGLHQFCIYLTGEGDKKLFREMKNYFPPAALAIFEIENSWADLKPRSGTLVDYSVTKLAK